MDQLPNELIQLVINELHPQDRLECIRVCRSWKKCMEITNPFNTVHVGSPWQLRLLLKKAQADNSLSTQVSNLIFDAGFSGDCEVIRVQKYLSHLGAFVCLANNGLVPNIDVAKCHPWSQLKHLALRLRKFNDVRHFIQDLCPNLTELVLSAPSTLNLTHLSRFLKNTPALTTLATCGFKLSIAGLEVMHRNLPLLTTLKLSGLYINRIDLYQLPSIIPATRVSTVYIDTFECELDAEIRLLQYISKKYNHAQRLVYKNASSRDGPCNEILTVIKSLGSHLTDLSLALAFNATDLVSALNDTHCQLKVLKVRDTSGIQDALAQYNSAHCIEKLCLSMHYNDEPLSIEKLACFSALKHLDIIIQKPDKVNISDLLGILGNQLESLGLYYVDLEYTPLENQDYPKYKLKKLTLSHTFILPHLDHFISQSLPHLRDLTFEHCTLYRRHLKLPNISLNNLLIKETIYPENNKLLVNTLNNGESRWYYAKPGLRGSIGPEPELKYTYGPTSTHPPVRCLSLDGYNGSPFATVECRSVYSVSLVYENAIVY